MIKRLLLFIVLLVVVVFIFRSKITGTVVKWDTQEIRQSDLPSIPVFSPPDESACEDALGERKVACDAYVAAFPDGCQWWHVAWISDCHEKRTFCFEKHDAAIDVCS